MRAPIAGPNQSCRTLFRIVIPSYHLGTFLRETIASIEAVRTPSLREVIIVDDGSTEPTTLEVLKEDL